MNTIENNDIQTSPVALAAALAAAQGGDCGKSWRRWRFHAAVRRCVALALVAVPMLLLVGSVSSALAHSTWATGASSTDESVANVRQMLNKQ